ncbi:MAG: acyltransferase [Pleurocapsa sp.]
MDADRKIFDFALYCHVDISLQTMLLKLQAKKNFINSINYFRGIAIVFIVLGHCYHLAHWKISGNLEEIIYSLTLNGSVYFVFISGFLFHHIFYHRFNYQQFMVKKLKYVLLPYLFFSVYPILETVYLKGGGQYLPNELRDKHLIGVLWYLVTGRISYAYWYIPMAILLFALSPVIIWLVQSNYLLKAILFLLPISMIIHRPVDNINTLQSLVYFLPVYLLGIYSSINKQAIYAYLKDKRITIFAIALALGMIQVILFKQSGNFHKEWLSLGVPDINLVQKLLLCFLLMSVLDIYEESDIPSLKKTAETSFAIYFIHPVLIDFGIGLTRTMQWNYQGNFLTLLLTTGIIVLLSMAIAYLVKTVFRRNSRYLIGW